jgi:hypothetical protein
MSGKVRPRQRAARFVPSSMMSASVEITCLDDLAGIDGVNAAARAQHQDGDKRERERETQIKSRPLPASATNSYFAAHTFQRVLHHVKTDAATRQRGDFSGGRKAGAKDQAQRLFLADPRARFEQSLSDGSLRHSLRIDAAPVVRHAHAHAAALCGYLHQHRPAL